MQMKMSLIMVLVKMMLVIMNIMMVLMNMMMVVTRLMLVPMRMRMSGSEALRVGDLIINVWCYLNCNSCPFQDVQKKQRECIIGQQTVGKWKKEMVKISFQTQMYEDFSADHANKTITMETHPHLPGPPQVSSVVHFKTQGPSLHSHFGHSYNFLFIRQVSILASTLRP